MKRMIVGAVVVLALGLGACSQPLPGPSGVDIAETGVEVAAAAVNPDTPAERFTKRFNVAAPQDVDLTEAADFYANSGELYSEWSGAVGSCVDHEWFMNDAVVGTGDNAAASFGAWLRHSAEEFGTADDAAFMTRCANEYVARTSS